MIEEKCRYTRFGDEDLGEVAGGGVSVPRPQRNVSGYESHNDKYLTGYAQGNDQMITIAKGKEKAKDMIVNCTKLPTTC